jgi:hypothetical protein
MSITRQYAARTIFGFVALGLMTHHVLAQCEADLRSTLRIDRSLAVTAGAVLDGADFSFRRTIGAILTSAGKEDTAAEREALVETMLLSFHRKRATNPVSGLRMSLDQRPGEAQLNAADLLDPTKPTGLIPIGLFNRLDLAPDHWGYCGEHRIVYSFKSGAAGGRLLLIFEAIVPNPRPDQGEAGCRPVANFWAGLSPDAVTDAERAARLQAFYYTGDLDGDSVRDVEPVVHFRHYGGDARGQVRGNLFVASNWQLREWRVVLEPASASPVFLHETIKNTPLVEFYADPEDPAAPTSKFIDRALGNEEATRYQVEFLVRYINNLIVTPAESQPAPGSPLSEEQLVFSKIGLGSDPRFDEFQGTSQGTVDMPSTLAPAGARIRVLLDGLLPQAQSTVPPAKRINATQALNRAYVATCAGCHQPTANGLPGATTLEVGPGLSFPNSHPAGFVHSGENRTLSPALNDHFLPVRKENLIAHLCRTAPTVIAFRRPVPSSLTAAREDIRNKVDQLRQEPSLQRRLDISGDVDRTVRALRNQDQSVQGAFTRARRPH